MACREASCFLQKQARLPVCVCVCGSSAAHCGEISGSFRDLACVGLIMSICPQQCGRECEVLLESPVKNCGDLVVSYYIIIIKLSLSPVSSRNSVVLTQGLCAVHAVFFSLCCWDCRTSRGYQGVSLVLESLPGCNLFWEFTQDQLSSCGNCKKY